MRSILALSFLFLLTSCGALAALQSKSGIDELSQKLDKFQAAEKKAREQADEDGDGKLSGSELLTYGSLLAAAELARRKAKSLDGKHAESAEHREELDSKVADLIRREDIRLALQREKDSRP